MKKQMRWMGCVGAGLVLMLSVLAQGSVVKSGEKIAFLGDSITQQGAGGPGGYVRLVISGLEANGIKAEAIPAGISGLKSNQMLERHHQDRRALPGRGHQGDDPDLDNDQGGPGQRVQPEADPVQ